MGDILGPMVPRRQSWVTTRWSIVSSLDHHGKPERDTSWQSLVDDYRVPMERYVRRVLGRSTGRTPSAEEASEIVQDFLVTCLEKDWLSRADPEKGRFRAYLQAVLRRYVYGQLRYDQAHKRSPGKDRAVVPFLDGDGLSRELSPEEQAELQEFDEGWVKVALDRALAQLAEEQSRYHTVVMDLLLTDGVGSPDLAERCGVRAAQFPVLKHRARQRLARLLAKQLEMTVGDEEAYREELRALARYIP